MCVFIRSQFELLYELLGINLIYKSFKNNEERLMCLTFEIGRNRGLSHFFFIFSIGINLFDAKIKRDQFRWFCLKKH